MNQLPAGWVWADLAQVCTSIADGDHQAPPQVPHGIPFLVIGNIRTQRLDFTGCRHVPPGYFASLSPIRQPQKGDVLYSLVGSYGISVQVKDNTSFCVQRHIGILRPSPSISPAFLALVLSSRAVFNQATQYATGTAQLTVPLSGLRRIRIPLPPLSEQDKIVAAIEEHFSRLDAGVAALRRALKKLARMRSAAFTLIIADSVDKWRTLGEIAEVVGGVTKDAKRQSDPAFVEVPYLRVANVQRGYLDLASVTTIRVPNSTVRKLRLERGDILFNEGGDRDKLGRGWIWEGQIEECIHQNHVFRARLLTDRFEPKFVSMHGNTFGQIWFEKMGKQTTNLASLSLTTLKSFPIPDLPVERQREIIAEVERQLTVLDSLQSATDQALIRSNALRSSILAAAFSGQLVPQDPCEEPASVLLERIAAEQGEANGHDPPLVGKRAVVRRRSRHE